MNVNLDFDLLLYGVMLAGFGVLAHRLAPDFGNAILFTGIAGGLASVLWGVLGLRGFQRRIWPISTLIVLVILLLIQTVGAWLKIKNGNDAVKPVAMILTLLLAFGIGQLLNFWQERSREK
jgi:hypothetical protein